MLEENKSQLSVHEVLHHFTNMIENPMEPVYVEYEELLQAWHDVRSRSDFSIESLLHFISKYSINTKSPYFLSKLYGGSDALSLFADMLISYYNTNVHVYSTSPVFTLAENLMIQRISHLMSQDSYGTGLFLPGGSYCNTVGIIAARHAHSSATKCHGNSTSLSIITSLRSHYSVDKAAIMLGIGLQNVIKIDFDTITSDELESIIVSRNVFCLVSTFGTTSEGILESAERWRAILHKHGVWHHVDAAIGGVLMYSSAAQHLTVELSKADSLTIDFHKLANISLQCSALMIHKAHKNILHSVTSVTAEYLFHAAEDAEDNLPAVKDIAAMSFQCGRRGDAFRLFVIDNLSSLRDRMDMFLKRVALFQQLVEEDSRYKRHVLISHVSVTHVMFTPTALIFNDEAKTTASISQVVRQLRLENIFVEYNTTYFRIVPVSPDFQEEHMRHLLDRIAHWSSEISASYI